MLHFENESGNADSEYLSDGLAESLIYRLSQVSTLRVIPRSSAFRYKGHPIDAEKIGNELGVDAVMSGRLTQRGEDLLISVVSTHHWYSRYLRAVGRTDEAFREIKRAEELDPLSLVIINNIAENYLHRGDLNSATRESQRMIDLDPNFWAAHQTLSIVLIKQGRYPEALLEAQKSTQFANRSNSSLALLGHVYGKLNRRSEAEAVIKELETRYALKEADGRDLAVVYAGLDDKEKAFAWLEKAFADKSVFLAFLKLEPLMDSLNSDPRWSDLERRVTLGK